MRTYSLYSLIVVPILLALAASAAPAPIHSLVTRQDNEPPFDGPRVVTTRKVTQVTGGSIVEDCALTFTPIVVDGKNLVREERRCTQQFIPNGQSLPAPSPPITTSQEPPATTTSTTTTTTTTEPPPQTTDAPPGTLTVTSSDPATSTTPPADTSSSSEGGGVTFDPPPPSDTSSSTSSPSTESASTPSDTPSQPPVDAPTSTTPGESSSSSPGVIVLGPTSVPAEDAESSGQNVPSGTRGNAEATQSADNVNIPGKSIEVLPIGLGVFAGISVIALIVVGLVTYERTKYRKAFRQRRLAASGAEMGYGGMSERR